MLGFWWATNQARLQKYPLGGPPPSVVGIDGEQAIEQTNGDLLVFTSFFNPNEKYHLGLQEKIVISCLLMSGHIKFLEV